MKRIFHLISSPVKLNNWEDQKSEKYTSSEMKTENSQLSVRRKILNGQCWHQQLSTLFCQWILFCVFNSLQKAWQEKTLLSHWVFPDDPTTEYWIRCTAPERCNSPDSLKNGLPLIKWCSSECLQWFILHKYLLAK